MKEPEANKKKKEQNKRQNLEEKKKTDYSVSQQLVSLKGNNWKKAFGQVAYLGQSKKGKEESNNSKPKSLFDPTGAVAQKLFLLI